MDYSFDWDRSGDTSQEALEEKNAGDSSQKSTISATLKRGLDYTDDEEEILRKDESHISDLIISPVFPRTRISGSFVLTPRVEEPKKVPQQITEKKADAEKLDLITPHSLNVNLGVDCPERPLKGRRSAVTPAVERSCRHLFTKDLGASQAQSENCMSSKPTVKVNQESSQSSSKSNAILKSLPPFERSLEHVKEDEGPIVKGKDDPEDNRNRSLEIAICTPEDNVGSPPFSSTPTSVCSMSSCSVSSCSSVSDLASPNLSEIKVTKLTFESSLGDIEDLVVEEAVCDPPIAEEEEFNIPDVDVKPFSPVKPPITTGNVDIAGNTLTSSIGSGPSNWTVVSGISPLPSSDPTHLRHQHFIYGHHNHHHHHHHRHHHHHHHHHHHNHGKNRLHGYRSDIRHHHSLSQSKIMVTSTPVHIQGVQNDMSTR